MDSFWAKWKTPETSQQNENENIHFLQDMNCLENITSRWRVDVFHRFANIQQDTKADNGVCQKRGKNEGHSDSCIDDISLNLT